MLQNHQDRHNESVIMIENAEKDYQLL